MSAAPDLFGECRDIADEVKLAQINVLAGRPVELGDLVARLAALTAASQTLPKAVQLSLVPTFETMHHAFDQLEALMRAAAEDRANPPGSER